MKKAGLYKTCKNHVNKQRRKLQGEGGYGRGGGGGGCK